MSTKPTLPPSRTMEWFLLVIFISQAFTITNGFHRVNSCKLEANTTDESYDLRLLSSATHDWSVKSNDPNATNFSMNICHPSSSCGKNEAVCGCIDGICTNLGSVLNQELKFDDEKHELVLTYRQGNRSACGASFNGTQSRSRIEFVCGTGAGTPEYVDRTVSGDECTFNFKWVTYMACKKTASKPAHRITDIQRDENNKYPVSVYDKQMDISFNVKELFTKKFNIPGVHNPKDTYNYLISLGQYVQVDGGTCDNASVCQVSSSLFETLFKLDSLDKAGVPSRCWCIRY